jgi:hypothetical protein
MPEFCKNYVYWTVIILHLHKKFKLILWEHSELSTK